MLINLKGELDFSRRYRKELFEKF